jgi:thiol-disulfide isomerase/thioredoxin
MLIGNPIELKGTTVDGDEFDWAQYRGKVVLVDFWATWCGPCIAELPNVKETYEKHHEHGFDVVGISLDDDADELKAFIEKREIPWTNLFGTEEARGWEHPMARRYGIDAIPATILVDREGKVVTLSARGEELGELVEKLLGSVDQNPEASKEKVGDKADSASETKAKKPSKTKK